MARRARPSVAGSSAARLVGSGQIYAQRGTLSFFWRSRYPVGPTEFPIFRAVMPTIRWDMVFLRMITTGTASDAFVTDASLARTRVSVTVRAVFPSQRSGCISRSRGMRHADIRFYVNGKLAAKNETVAGLQRRARSIWPARRVSSARTTSRAITTSCAARYRRNPHYDRMLDDAAVATLAKGRRAGRPRPLPPRKLRRPPIPAGATNGGCVTLNRADVRRRILSTPRRLSEK